jgi:iron(III) transport system substrate-binding protein
MKKETTTRAASTHSRRFGWIVIRLVAAVGATAGMLFSAAMSIAQTVTPGAAPPDWTKTVAAARSEGKVHVYSSQPPQSLERLIAGFRKTYPDIAVEFIRGPSGQLLPKVEQERASGLDGADLWITAEVTWFEARGREGKLLRLSGPALKGWPTRYLRQDAIAIVGFDPFIISYNKTQVPNPPKGYADLLKPEFKGRLGTSDLAGSSVLAWYDWLEKTQGADYLTRLKAQGPKLYNGSVPLSQAVAAGEIAIGVFATPTTTRPLMDQGAPIDYVVPNQVLANLYAVTAFGWSKRPNAAVVFIDYVMSREGQAVWHGRGESVSPLPGIPGAFPATGVTPWDADAYPPDVAAKYRERWSKIFK